jgi:hypothetical protein
MRLVTCMIISSSMASRIIYEKCAQPPLKIGCPKS